MNSPLRWPLLPFILCGLLSSIVHHVDAQLPIRLCVPSTLDVECIGMRQDVGQSKIQCIFARDRLECMEKVQRNNADLVYVDASDVYVAGKDYQLTAFVMEEVNRSDYLYQSAVVIKKSSEIRSLRDLKKKNSCHTGMGRTAGWNIPVGVLLDQGVMEPDCRGELYTVARFFNSSCAPGPWSKSDILDAKLKQEHPSLCSLCDDPLRCLPEDNYAGYEGVLRCLTEGKGDVAFTKPSAVQEFLSRHPREVNNLQYLCIDGSRKGVMEGEPCTWANKPTNVFVGSPKKLEGSQTSFHRTLSQIFNNFKSRPSRPSWFEQVLVSGQDTTDFLLVPVKRHNWEQYLGNYKLAIERELLKCPNKTVTFCVTSEWELDKCREFSLVAYARNVRPRVACVNEKSQDACIQSVSKRKSDIITLDGGDIFTAARDQGLRPIAQEIYDESEASYFAVAVIKDSSKINEISDLKGKRSCHPMIGQTSGWIIPMATLLEEELVPNGACDRLSSAANFFSSACLPGANNTRYNNNQTVAEILCKQCIGNDDGEKRCSRESDERYGGESGAFRCLSEGAGDVAFLRHSTPFDLTERRSRLHWTAGLRVRDYKLLCRQGGTARLEEYQTCHLARIPSHHVMISSAASEEVLADTRQFVASTGAAFGSSAKSLSFKLFGSYNSVPDLLFKDETTDLRVLSNNDTAQSILGPDFNEAMRIMYPESCHQVGAAPTITAISSAALMMIIMLVMREALNS